MANARIGIDVGGTFTDLVLLDEFGEPVFHKLPSTPGAPHLAPIRGIVHLLEPQKSRRRMWASSDSERPSRPTCCLSARALAPA
jgi:N-methylhydantoinase A/oxoprolinase/acetone carboxylase beta subunit